MCAALSAATLRCCCCCCCCCDCSSTRRKATAERVRLGFSRMDLGWPLAESVKKLHFFHEEVRAKWWCWTHCVCVRARGPTPGGCARQAPTATAATTTQPVVGISLLCLLVLFAFICSLLPSVRNEKSDGSGGRRRASKRRRFSCADFLTCAARNKA